MNWWNQALFDTCSVITLDKLRQEEPMLARHFSASIRVILATFSEDQLNEDTSGRMRPILTLQEIPSNEELAKFLKKFNPSIALSDVDKLVLATAVLNKLAVVTADRQLGKAVVAAGLQVANMALILKELVNTKKLSQSHCEKLLIALARRNDLILGTKTPTWPDLKKHRFPQR
jgi:hypothetical protein